MECILNTASRFQRLPLFNAHISCYSFRMDPVSCTGTVIAVIQLTGSLLGICGGYLSKVKRAQKDIQDLAKEVRGLQTILESLNELLSGPNSKKLTAPQELRNQVTECSLSLEDLKKKIVPKTTRNKWGFRSLKWPLQRREVDEAIHQIERYKSSFILALQAGQVQTTDRIERKLDLDKLNIAQGAAFDSYDNKHAECHAGTRKELLRQIEEWADSPLGKCIFWLNGKAGTGKSTVSQTIASRLKSKQRLGASFFFKRGEKDRGNAKKLFPTLIRQLLTTIPQLQPSIQQAIEDDPYISEKSLGEQFNKLLLQPLLNVDLKKSATLIIVIDALDECESEENRDDIKVILQLLPQVSGLQLRFFLTSRPELPIRLGFKNVEHQNLDLHEIPKAEITHDISMFLESRLREIQSNRSLPMDWPGKTNIQKLVEMAVPLFIFATTICRILEDEQWNPKQSLLQILEHQADTQSPDTSQLSGTYLPVLDRVLMNQEGRRKTQLIEEYRTVLGTIILLEIPLSVTSLSVITGIPKETINTRLDSLHSVLCISRNEAEPVRLFHLSFRDFLLDPDTRVKTHLWIDEKERNKFLTLKCLEIMNQNLQRNICRLSCDSVPLKDIDVKVINHYFPPELQYACQYWAHHLLKSSSPSYETPSHESAQAFSFLTMHFLHWVEAMSILGIISEVIRIIQKLQLVMQNSQNPEIINFLRDSKRFILKNRQIAETAPLQLYTSALMFSPGNSIIRQRYKNELSDWPQLPTVEDSWSADLQTLEGHSSSIQSVAFSPDSHMLASGSADKTIKVWDAMTGELHHTLQGHSNWVRSVVFSPNGHVLASGSVDKTIKLWDVVTGELCHTLEGHSSWVWSVAISPDNILASGSEDRTIKLWDAIKGGLQHTLVGHSSPVRSVAFSPDGHILASGSSDNTIKLWDAITGSLQYTFEGHLNWVQSIAFSPDGHVLASGSVDKTIKLWDAMTGGLHHTLEGHSSPVQSVVFSPDGHVLVSGSDDMTIKIWDAMSGGLRHTLKGHSSTVQSLAFSPDGCLLASGSVDTTIKLWDAMLGGLYHTHHTHHTHHLILPHSDLVQSVAFSPHHHMLASGSSDKTIKLRDAMSGGIFLTLEGHSDLVRSVVFSPDGFELASGSNDKTIKIWDGLTGELHLTLKGHSDSVRSVVFSPDNRMLASGSNDKTIKLWDVVMGELRHTLEGHSSWVQSVAFSPNGCVLASGSIDTTIKLWDVMTGRLHHTLRGHSDLVQSVAFSPSGNVLVSSSGDKTIKLWDAATGELRHTLGGHSHPVLLDDRVVLSIYESQWIYYKGQKILWLPKEHRPTSLAVRDGILALGHASGRVSFISGFI